MPVTMEQFNELIWERFIRADENNHFREELKCIFYCLRQLMKDFIIVKRTEYTSRIMREFKCVLHLSYMMDCLVKICHYYGIAGSIHSGVHVFGGLILEYISQINWASGLIVPGMEEKWNNCPDKLIKRARRRRQNERKRQLGYERAYPEQHRGRWVQVVRNDHSNTAMPHTEETLSNPTEETLPESTEETVTESSDIFLDEMIMWIREGNRKTPGELVKDPFFDGLVTWFREGNQKHPKELENDNVLDEIAAFINKRDNVTMWYGKIFQ